MASQIAMLLPNGGPAPHQARGPFRRARAQDEPALAALLAAAFPTEQWSVERVRRELTQAPDVLEVLVADGDDGSIVATASARHFAARFAGAGYVHWVAVAPDARGAGLGRQAVIAVLDAFVQRGLAPVVLETDDERLAAISTYLGLGFVPLYRDEDHPRRWSHIFNELARARKAVSA